MVLEYIAETKDKFEAVSHEEFTKAIKDKGVVRENCGERPSFTRYFISSRTMMRTKNSVTELSIFTKEKCLLARASGIDAQADKISDAIFAQSCAPFATCAKIVLRLEDTTSCQY